MGRIKQTLLDEGRGPRPNRPKNLRPLSAPYQKKRRMFLSITKGRNPKAPTLEDDTSVLLVFGLLKPRKSFAERHIFLDRAPGLPI
jgi:hypothetical protein